ncbi:disulfide oxidoreductase [Paenibacillus apiarius]|uniref:Disulfide oxidoreductase n=1 Tax=Paenibacillus apiarius TaxID=46240 RepID=A0ABT4DPM4_9BACL|nr:disulfide oxidoreductase [Paenibacillus apiarius]MBN3524733.1 disulfide bond formation protein B [Paenibacillus apiarius]MCY9515621.1 disulfide oxidoreductase [Paenibacillus apiarius]MCY9519306.1 disulfide oxidoreductase [Paenibacillus apiarius]MCY9550942.1 disulfide oxidoreductase [Paenibacillus apiarius]MCY9558966.1 disulfide oxidoreductase [Paenibacillus apiarius]
MMVIRRYALHFAWLVSFVAAGGSLYMSDILFWEPCKLCWFQRIFMYPLVILLGIAAYRNDRSIVRYTLPLSIIGGLISTYHYMVQKIPAMADTSPCRSGIPCNTDYLDAYGWITIPLLAFVAFLLITILLLLANKHEPQE